MKVGPNNLITDVEGFLVGNAEDHTLKSGVSVLAGEEPFVSSAHIMGGAPGTRDTDLLEPDKLVDKIDALVLSGGSAFGLDSASGVVEGLLSEGRGFLVGPVKVPLVPTAILFDLLNGANNDWIQNPYPALGRLAYDAKAKNFELGTVGAGTGALTACHKGGLGSASLITENGFTIGALVAVNAIGAVTYPGGNALIAAPFEMEHEFGNAPLNREKGLCRTPDSRKLEALNPKGNTTIAIVATDAILSKADAKRLAIAAHDGFARAILPAHTPFDGDIVFAASSGRLAMNDHPGDLKEICHAAALTLTRAIGRAVYNAHPSENDLLPCWRP